jgi:hypothetical protein
MGRIMVMANFQLRVSRVMQRHSSAWQVIDGSQDQSSDPQGQGQGNCRSRSASFSRTGNAAATATMSLSFFTRQWSSSMATGGTHCDSLLEEISLKAVRGAMASRALHSTSNKHRDWRQELHGPCLVLTSDQAAEQLRMLVDKGPAQHAQCIVFESTCSGTPSQASFLLAVRR